MLQRLLRRQSALQAASSFTTKPAFAFIRHQSQSREQHRMPQLPHDPYYKENGIPDLLSPQAYDFSWTQYQKLLLDKLNLLTQDTADAGLTPGELLVKYSRRPEMAVVFNYASMAHNNHFFFNCLSPSTTQMPEALAKDIGETCSSIESLKLDFLATASAMFGPGFVWLAKNLERDGLIHIFCTYNAGSPYPHAHYRRQPIDTNTHTPGTALGNQYAGSMGRHAENQKNMAPGALDVQPILCVNTWEHVWMVDYGVGGKDAYLERWWDRINWDVVHDNYNAVAAQKPAKGLSGRNPNAAVHRNLHMRM